MDGEIRRREIVKRLRETEKPISATRFAKAFDVSRQIIVGDVALLRATGVEIVATARGYMLEQPLEGIERKIACQHTPEQTREELSVIVAKRWRSGRCEYCTSALWGINRQFAHSIRERY